MDRFEELTTPHLGVLFRMAYHLSGDRDNAEDLVQDVFIKARKAFHSLKDPNKTKSWLCSILYRQFIDECRRKKNHVEFHDDVPAPEEENDFEWPENITKETLTACLDNLDPKYKLPLVAYFLSDQSYKEISESLEVPLGTVMSRIHRAKNIMRKELTKMAARPPLRVVNGGRNGV